MSRSIPSIIIAIFLIQGFFYIIAATLRTDKVTDLAYGLTFVFLAIWGYIQSSQATIHLIITILICLWGIRLASYLFIRILKIKKDERFNQMRNNRISFGKFWILQTISIFIIFLPIIWIFQNNTYNSFSTINIIGVILFIIGLSLESIADQQKYQYKIKNPKHWTDTGLRKYSRHPNYLGEIIVQIGIFIISIPVLSSRQWLSIISPIFISTLLLFVSGVPLLEKQYEKKYGKDKDYIKYKKSTRLLFPIKK